jgi:dTDP-4-dehydrorhamnose reductase
MKIIVVGKGWTGNKVFLKLQEKSANVLHVSHHEILNYNISGVDVIVNCAGVTGVPNVDACELDQAGTFKGNTIFPIALYELCLKENCRLAHFSSGCIYSGTIDTIDAEPNFFGSTYSISKGISDSYLKNRAMVFRIRMPFTNLNEPKNYLTKVKNYAIKAKLFDSGQNSLTDHNEAVKVACDLILKNSENRAYNLVNSGSISMMELVDLLKINTKWFTEDEFYKATKAKRSTCVIPAYEKMRPLKEALEIALHENRI